MSSAMSKPGSSDPRKAKQEVGSKSKGKVGDWFRHVSSSGKEYYYNITSHASQWEKPREWLDYEKRFGPVPYHSSSSSKPNSQHHHHVQQQQHQQQQQQQQQHSSSSASSVVEKALAEREREREQREREFRERDRDRGDRYHHHQQQQQHHHHAFNNSSSSTNMNSSATSTHSHHSSYAHSSHSSSSSAAYDRQRGEYPIPSTSHTSSMLSHHHQQQQQQQQQHHHLQQHSSSSSSHPHQNHPAMSSSSSSFSHSHHHHSASTSSSSSSVVGSNRGVHNHSDMSASHHGHPSSNNSSGLHSHNYGMHPHQQSRHFPDGVHLRHAVPSTSAAAALRDTRKPSEDLQAEDMDISPLDDSSSPISLDSKKIVASSSSNFRDSHQYPHASTNSSNKAETIDLTREDLKNVNSSFLMSQHQQQQQQMGGRLNLIPIPTNVGNNGYGGRDRERERDQRDRDIRENRERERLGLDRDNNQRDQRDNRQIHRDVRDSPRRDRDRGRPRDRTDHRERDRDRDQHRERDRSRSRLRDERSRSPWDRDGTPERPSENTGSGNIGSLATLAALSQQPDAETPPLPPSLAQYYREDLIAHVKELPGDALERQANKIFDEIMTTTAIQISKVSTELKMARSLVRLTDIQATLQEQRILFLRQQIESLEASERDNSAMLGVDTVDP